MSNVKISALDDGGALQDTDEFIAARSGDNVKILGSALGGSLPDPIVTPVTIAVPSGDALTIAPEDGYEDFPFKIESPQAAGDGYPLAQFDASDVEQVFAVNTDGSGTLKLAGSAGFQVYDDTDATVLDLRKAGSRIGNSDGTLGFFGTGGVARPTVNNATAADIIAALAALGLIIDGT